MEVLNKDIRKRVIMKGKELGFGHYCSAMSCLDACVYLYREVLTDDDVFIMGKGHGIIAVIPILEDQGKKVDWKPYLDYNPEMGIQATTASLGHGLPIALGRAYAKKVKGEKGNVYVMVGDGEIQEGSNWEALQILHKLQLDNLFVLIDWNKYQAVDTIKSVMNEDGFSLKRKLEAFGRRVIFIDAHDNQELRELKYLDKGPFNAVILDSIKGHGIPILERNKSWHVFYFHEHLEAYDEALAHLSK